MLLWFAVGAVACNAATLWLLVRAGAPVAAVGRHAVPLAALATTAAVAGSLYLSEVAHFLPCRYCWFQRIAMYPLALVLVIAWITGDKGVRRYALPLSLVGLAFSVWHYLVQRFPSWESSGSCDIDNPCTLTLAWKFHFVSIPYMAGSVFALTTVMLLVGRRVRR